MEIDTFEMERMQSAYENEVELNLSESGVHSLRISDLLSGNDTRSLLDLELGYPPAPGSDRLRENIATWYPGATKDHVTVTNGGAEANFLTAWTLLDKSQRVAFMLPNYMQGWALARHFGSAAEALRLRFQSDEKPARWTLGVDELDRAVGRDTKIIWICNPNNPTASVLSRDEMTAVVEAAERAGAWILADEIYRGAEADGETTSTFWGMYDKVVVTSGLSKVFGMAGLRLGWVVAPSNLIPKIWRHRDYTTLMVGCLSDELASRALEPSMREQLLARSRSLVRRHLPVIDQWAQSNEDLVSYARPQAGAIAYFSYRLPIEATELADRFRTEESVLVVPGDQLGLSRGFRIGFGHDAKKTAEGLRRVEKVMRTLAA